MISRCYYTTDRAYKYYGAKGIGVCSEWKNSKEEFIRWAMSNGYADNLTLDRKNNKLNYSPKNCRFVTMKEQLRNTSNNVNYKGECAIDASTRLGGGRGMVYSRIRRGWSKKKAFTTPI